MGGLTLFTAKQAVNTPDCATYAEYQAMFRIADGIHLHKFA